MQRRGRSTATVPVVAGGAAAGAATASKTDPEVGSRRKREVVAPEKQNAKSRTSVATAPTAVPPVEAPVPTVAKANADLEADEPTPIEERAMSVASYALLESRLAMEATRKKNAPLRQAGKTLRLKLFQFLTAHELDIVAIPEDLREEANVVLRARDLPEVPLYVRIFLNNRDKTIQPETARPALELLDVPQVEAVMKAARKPLGVAQAFQIAVADSVRDAVREHTKQVKLMSSVPKGMDEDDIPEAPHEVGVWAVALHKNDAVVAAYNATRKAEDATWRKRVATVEPVVEAFFGRRAVAQQLEAGTNVSQRLNLHRVPYRLVLHTSTTKPRIGFGTIGAALWTGMATAWALPVPAELQAPAKRGARAGAGGAGAGAGEPKKQGAAAAKAALPPDPIGSLDALAKLLAERRPALIDAVIGNLAALPRTVKTTLKLYDVAAPRMRDPK